MNLTTLSLLSAGLVAGPMAAHAQEQTWDYTGQVMATGQNGEAPDALDAVFVFSQPLNPNLANQSPTLASWSISGMGLGSGYDTYEGGPSLSDVFTTTNGSITGWQISASDGITQGTNTTYSSQAYISSTTGDSFSGYFNTPSCNAPPGVPVPCYSVNESTSAAGVWVDESPNAAPEIDPASAVGGLTLLLGVMAIVRGRRSAQRVAGASPVAGIS